MDCALTWDLMGVCGTESDLLDPADIESCATSKTRYLKLFGDVWRRKERAT
jgi:hypothetical protein